MPKRKCNACLIYAEIKKSRNHLVLCHDKVYRLLGISDDKQDWYYMLENLHGEMLYSSCCMDFVELHGLLKAKDYSRLNSLFKMNKQPQKKKMMKDMSEKLPQQCYCDKIPEEKK